MNSLRFSLCYIFIYSLFVILASFELQPFAFVTATHDVVTYS
jgi:hypothetical protein